MRPDRLMLYFFLMILALGLASLYGCGPAAQGAAMQTHSPHATNPSHQMTPVPQIPRPTPLPTVDPTQNPVRLLIPSIDINAPVESLGIQANGDMATPTRNPWEDVGWYNGG